MNDKEAKETLKTMKENIDKKYLKTRNSVAIETILNILENQKVEIEEKDKSLKLHTKLEYQYKNDYLNVIEDLEKKDKQIDLMANNLIGVVFSDNDNKEILFDNKEDVKQYYEKKSEEDK